MDKTFALIGAAGYIAPRHLRAIKSSGGHCIPVDPYYLTAAARLRGLDTPLLDAACCINGSMPRRIVMSAMRRLESIGCRPERALVMGLAFKENVGDIRNSQSAVVVSRLCELGVNVDVMDSHVDPDAAISAYGIRLVDRPRHAPYQLVVVATAHDEYRRLDNSFFESLAAPQALLVDICNIYRDRNFPFGYMSL